VNKNSIRIRAYKIPPDGVPIAARRIETIGAVRLSTRLFARTAAKKIKSPLNREIPMMSSAENVSPKPR